MSNGQQAQNTLYENAIGWSILLAVFAVLLWIFWYYFDDEVRGMVRWIRYMEMWLISFFVDDNFTVFYNGKQISFFEWYENTPKWHRTKLTYDHLALFNALAMQPLKITFVSILGVAGLWAMFKGPGTHYRSNLGLEGLISRQARNFPVIAPFVAFNPAQQKPRPPGSPVPAELPPFAEALGPEEWLAYCQIPIPDGKIDEAAAAAAFEKQLGRRWKGPTSLEPYQQVLLAAFCLKAARKRKEADNMLGELALCWSAKRGLKVRANLAKEARKILRNRDLAGKTLAKVNQHAFETTALMRGLATAREEGGVLAPAQFVWLRAHDRTLWYPLNNLGRQSYHLEALGAMSHYKAEKLTSRPIPVAKVGHAVETIVKYMKSGRARPVPQLDYSGSKTRGIKKAK